MATTTSGSGHAAITTVPYSVHPVVAYQQAIIANLPQRSGRSLDQWLRLVRNDGPREAAAAREWLKKKHTLGGTTAHLIAEIALGDSPEDWDGTAYLSAAPGYVQRMYAGPKAHLKPIHDELIRRGRALGKDVKICPCRTIVPLYRNNVFAQIKPSTQKRIDLGLALKNATVKPPKRLIDTGGSEKGDRITHRIPIESLDDIDATVKKWLKAAYDADA